MSQQQQIRRLVMTGAVAAVTVTGAWYGAGLKTRQEFKQEKKVVLEASPQERISQLENARARLVTRRTELEKRYLSSKPAATRVPQIPGLGLEFATLRTFL